MPFPYYGDIHPGMYTILDVCAEKGINVHVDSAWISCIRDIEFDFDHPAIKSFAISLSKGGIGGNRIGVRYSREVPEGSITMQNLFHMNQQPLMWIGTCFMREFGPEYFWKKYREKYDKVCADFKLTPSKAIHLAMSDGKPARASVTCCGTMEASFDVPAFNAWDRIPIGAFGANNETSCNPGSSSASFNTRSISSCCSLSICAKRLIFISKVVTWITSYQ